MATTNKLKIGYILDTSLDPDDGVQQYVVAIGEWMRSQGHEVHYLVGETKNRRLQNIHSLTNNISVTFNGNQTTIPSIPNIFKLKKFINQANFDILHVQTPHHPLLAQTLILSTNSSTAVIATFHILPYGKLATLGTSALAKTLIPSLKRIDKLLAVSPAAASFVKKSYKMDSMVVPNVVDYKWYKSAKPLDKFNDDIITILFLGRLVPRKGCLTLLKAVLLLSSKIHLPKYRVVICGKGPLQAELENFVMMNNLEKIIRFEGYIEENEKPKYYASADISVFPSSGGESFGIVLLEAMASGRSAILAGDNPGYSSVLLNREDLLFDPFDEHELADKISNFLIDETLRRTTASWGSNYTSKFDIPVVGDKLLTIYNAALQKRRQQ